MDAVSLHKGPIDLGFGVLVLTNDDGIVVLPQQQVILLLAAAQYCLLKSQVVRRVLGTCFQVMGLRAHGILLS